MTTGSGDQHVFGARRYGQGLCAFCDQYAEGSNHRPITEAERESAQAIIDRVVEGVTSW